MNCIDPHGYIDVLVWNLHKQNAPQWRSDLVRFSQNAQLVLLQEVRLTPLFKRFIKEFHWYANHVHAFAIFNNSSGVLTAGKTQAQDIYCYLAPEPIFRLPKSCSMTRYKLSNGEILTVVNVHLINFTLGLKAYRKQMQTLIDDLQFVHGPVIFAGDFNTWSRERQTMIDAMMAQLGLQAATYTHDLRRCFMAKRPLDHLYYRGLVLQKADVLQTQASDHNPILARFVIK